jgi:hypothetical protein
MPVPGTRLGRFEILELLGAGGMGEVYRARDLRLGREVALKLLPEQFVRDTQRLARFERETQVLASLNQPNIAALHEIVSLEGTARGARRPGPRGAADPHRTSRGLCAGDAAGAARSGAAFRGRPLAHRGTATAVTRGR